MKKLPRNIRLCYSFPAVSQEHNFQATNKEGLSERLHSPFPSSSQKRKPKRFPEWMNAITLCIQFASIPSVHSYFFKEYGVFCKGSQVRRDGKSLGGLWRTRTPVWLFHGCISLLSFFSRCHGIPLVIDFPALPLGRKKRKPAYLG